jgi:hypothetical protein
MREDQIDQAERRATLENDLRVLEQRRGSTMHQFAQSAANDTGGGRFASLGAPHVTGSAPVPKYPAAGAHQADPVGTEPPLGFSINEMPGSELPSTNLSVVEETGGAAAPSAPPDVEPAPPSSSERDDG